MNFKSIGTSPNRWDAHSKVTGKAQYTEDFPMNNLLHSKILRSTIAHGKVLSIDYSEALKVPGVLKVVTYEDSPTHPFQTAGKPYSLLYPKVKNRLLFNQHVRLYGDEIGAVIGETSEACELALSKIKVTYEEYPFYLTVDEAMEEGAKEIHEGTNNILLDLENVIGDPKKAFEEAAYVVEGDYETPIVQHCQMENQISRAYKDEMGRWVCVSSTQIPHLCRYLLADVFSMDEGDFRVIKPFIGGGFGNKQDMISEPYAVFFSMVMNGAPVELNYEREECIAHTRVRHAMKYHMKMAIDKEYNITGFDMRVLSQTGAYSSHGHSIAFVGEETAQLIFNCENFRAHSTTVYTNTSTGGAFRGYGTPQVKFAIGALAQKAARKLGIDEVEFLKQNVVKAGETSFGTGIEHHTNDLVECLELGSEQFNWEEKKKTIKEKNTDTLKYGIGVAGVCYASNTRPSAPGNEVAGCLIILNQDGSLKMSVGATEIGQGSDTVFMQMVAEETGVTLDKIYADQITDTDISPYDPGSYASRQSYVSGKAVKKAAIEIREKILKSLMKFHRINEDMVYLKNNNIYYKHNDALVMPIKDLALETYYSVEKGECIVANVSIGTEDNSYSNCVTYAEVCVDVKTGKVEIEEIRNIHDAGTVLNRNLSEGQVHGGMLQGIAYGLSEIVRYDSETGKPLNDNLLDYKMPTMLDAPDLECDFVEPYDPRAPYGNKALGEPPLCSPAPAIRNAIVDAIGVEINHIPIMPQDIVEKLSNK